MPIHKIPDLMVLPYQDGLRNCFAVGLRNSILWGESQCFGSDVYMNEPSFNLVIISVSGLSPVFVINTIYRKYTSYNFLK